MRWAVETHDATDAEIEALPPGLQARLIRLMEAVENVGLEQLREPHVKHLEGKLWELRAKAAEGIARGIYVTVTGRRVIVLHRGFREEVTEDATRRAGNSQRANEGGEAMTKIAELKKRLMNNPAFRQEYEKADAEFQLVEALIGARTKAKLSQAELARRIGTTQSAIARLEGGGVSPSLNTLRRYAEATGSKLEINLVRS